MPWRGSALESTKEERPKWGAESAVETEMRGLASTTASNTPTPTHTLTHTKISIPSDTAAPKWENKTDTHLSKGTSPRPKIGNHIKKPEEWEQKRDVVNLKIVGGSSNSSMTRSGNNNTIEVYIVGNGEDVVNITVAWEGEGDNIQDSGNGNTVRVYIGDSNGVDMGNSTLKVIGGES